MKKGIAWLLLLILLFPCHGGMAHTRVIHDRELEHTLFGFENYKDSQESKERAAILALESAVYLCLDQYNGNGAQDFQRLIDYKVSGMPSGLEAIDFLDSSAHRRATHRGWNPINVIKITEKNWEARKNILLGTVNKIFDFGIGTDISLFGLKLPYDEQCEGFAALCYYVHVLGDIEDLDDFAKYRKEGSYTIPLARHAVGESNPDIIWELTEVFLPSLFASQVESSEYQLLIHRLDQVAIDARNLAGSIGGINDEEKFEQYKQYTMDVQDILYDGIPPLLKKEKFFSEVFGQ